MSPVDMLAFERRWWSVPGAKERAIREDLGMSPIAYYQQLNQLLEAGDGVMIDAQTVSRLRRLRDQTARRKS